MIFPLSDNLSSNIVEWYHLFWSKWQDQAQKRGKDDRSRVNMRPKSSRLGKNDELNGACKSFSIISLNGHRGALFQTLSFLFRIETSLSRRGGGEANRGTHHGEACQEGREAAERDDENSKAATHFLWCWPPLSLSLYCVHFLLVAVLMNLKACSV